MLSSQAEIGIGFLLVISLVLLNSLHMKVAEQHNTNIHVLITTGKNDKGLKLYDPGYLNTAHVRSSICYIDGDEGILRYRGYPIEELAEGSTFLEVAYLLMYGNLPNGSQLADWEFAVSQHSAVPQGILITTEKNDKGLKFFEDFLVSLFWNFDAHFQPQQHPARDSHDTFFWKAFIEPSTTKTLPEDYVERMKQVHESGGYGSRGKTASMTCLTILGIKFLCYVYGRQETKL